MTFSERAERLKTHPDTVTVEFCGEEVHWYLGKLTYDLARAKGIELGDVIGAFDGVEEDAGIEVLEPLVKAGARLVYFGRLPFEEGLEEADVSDFFSVGDIHRVIPPLMDSLGAAAGAEAAGKAEAAQRKAQGAADRRKGRP